MNLPDARLGSRAVRARIGRGIKMADYTARKGLGVIHFADWEPR